MTYQFTYQYQLDGANYTNIAVPNDYKRVEYIERNSGSRIDTGIVTTATMEWRFKYAMNAISSYVACLNSYLNETTNATRIIANATSATDVRVNFMTRANASILFSNVTQAIGDTIEGYINKNTGQLNSVKNSLSATAGTADTNTTMKVMNGPSKVWYLVNRDNNADAHIFLPVVRLSDSVAGLYNTIDDTFLTADGVTAGPDYISPYTVGDVAFVVENTTYYLFNGSQWVFWYKERPSLAFQGITLEQTDESRFAFQGITFETEVQPPDLLFFGIV